MDFDGIPVRNGRWLYGGTEPSEVVVVRRDTCYGSGDHEDPPDVREDVDRETFEVLFSVAGETSRFVGGGQFLTLTDAVAAAQRSCGPTLSWNPDRYPSRDDFERSDQVAPLCRALGSLLQYRLANASDPAREAVAIAHDLRAAGHDLWSWDESDDFSIWGDDYAHPPLPTRFLIEMRWPSVNREERRTQVEVTFGLWPRRR